MWHYLDIHKIVFENNAIVAIGFYELNNKKIIILRRMKFYDSVWWLSSIKNKDDLNKNKTLESKSLEVLKLKSLIVASNLGWGINKIL